MILDWQAEDVLRAVRGQCLHEQIWAAQGVSIDSRTTRPGDLFIALEGPHFDAHIFVREAFAAGATAAIVHRAPPHLSPEAPLLYVEDTFTALQDLGRVARGRTKAQIIAVTGSVGKTTSKEILRLMLGSIADTYANEGSLNNRWGVPLSMARMPQNANYGVFEIGMNRPNEIGPLAHEVQPHVALITTVEPVHLANFPSVEAIADAKAEVFQGMDPAGTAVLNRDNPHYARLLAAARTQGLRRILSFGSDSKGDARLLACRSSGQGSEIEAIVMDQHLAFSLEVPGAHIAMDAVAALLAATAAGADPVLCVEALSAYRPLAGRGAWEKIHLNDTQSFTLIDESYNASPVAMRAALRTLGQTPLKDGGRRIAILGDMRELGPTAPQLHAGLFEAIEAAGIDIVHCCGENMEYLYNVLPASKRGHYRILSADLAPRVASAIRPNDIVMVKGSKSVKMPAIVAALRDLDMRMRAKQMLAG
jgi:UDP-N-acetylmuramoyl-tripeptide--D-alanyl-D-alanine ligase